MAGLFDGVRRTSMCGRRSRISLERDQTVPFEPRNLYLQHAGFWRDLVQTKGFENGDLIQCAECDGAVEGDALQSAVERRANSARTRQSRPDSGVGFEGKSSENLRTFAMFFSSRNLPFTPTP